MKRKIVFPLTLIFFSILLVSCSSAYVESKPSIGIFMPCKSNTRWITEASEMQQLLEDEGYEVKVYFAEKSSRTQKQQVKTMIEYGADALIISPVEADDLSTILNTAHKNDIVVIAYNELLTNTEGVDAFASFDNNLIGVQQATSLVEGMRSAGEGPYNIEIFIGNSAGSSTDEYYKGVMSVLRPLIKKNEINVPSGQVSTRAISNNGWDLSSEVDRFKLLISNYYSNGTPLNGVLSPTDKLTLKFIDILNDENYYSASAYPVITGQNAELQNLKAIVDSKQHSTIYKDSDLIAQVTCSMVIALLNGQEPEINDNTSFYNGVKIVPAFLCEPILVDKSNYQSILIDTGYIKYEDIFPGE